MTFTQLGLIGSLAYLGSGIGALFLPILMRKFQIKLLLITLLSVNSGCSVAVGLAKEKWQIYLARFAMGLTQSFITCYAPIWVNNKAPVNKATRWMGYMNSFSTLGIMIGYTTASIIISIWNKSHSVWRWGFFIQTFLQMVVLFLAFFIPN